MTLLRHAILFVRLFRERRDNPLATSYHFGRRVGKRGIGYFVLRGALALGPLLAVGMCMNFSFDTNVSEALRWYSMIGVLYLWLLPPLIFQFFGVKKLDRQNVEDLTVTRLSGSEIVFGLFFWPSMTVFFAAFPYFCGATLLLMFSDRNIEFSILFPVMLVTGAFVIVSSLVFTLSSFAADLRSRILGTLAHGVLMLATLFGLFTIMHNIILANESIPYISPMNLIVPAVLLLLLVAKVESLFTGSSWRLLHPPFVMPKFPLVPFIQRARMWWAGFFAAALTMMICFNVSVPLTGMRYSDFVSPRPNIGLDWQALSSVSVAVIGWGIIPVLAFVGPIVQVYLLRRYMRKVRVKDPHITLRLPRLHFAGPPFLIYAVCFSNIWHLVAGGWNFNSAPILFAVVCVLIPIFSIFSILTTFTTQWLLLSSRPRILAYTLLFSAVIGHIAILVSSVMTASHPKSYYYSIGYTPLGPMFSIQASWHGALLLFGYVVVLAILLNGGLKIMMTRVQMRVSKNLDDTPKELLRVTPS